MYIGSHQDFYWNKCTHKSLDVVFPHLNIERGKIRQYLSNILKCDTQSDDMKRKIDHWLDSFENFQQQYFIISTESKNSYDLLSSGS